MYFLLKVYKVAQGKVENVIKLYKDSKYKPKIKEQILSNELYQEFFWSFAPIFTLKDEQINLNEGFISFLHFYPCNLKTSIEIYQIIQGSKEGVFKKGLNSSGMMLLEVKLFDEQKFKSSEEERTILFSNESLSYNPNWNISDYINNYKKDLKKEKVDPNIYQQLQILEFQNTQQKCPYFNLVHELFIYPDSVNLTNINLDLLKSIKSKVFNIFLKVKFTKNDNDNNLFHSQILHKKVDCYTSDVQFETCIAQFHDEIKISIPIPLDMTYQLIFTFYHYNVEKKEHIPLGICQIPLSNIIKESKFTLPICKSEKDETPFNPKMNNFNFHTRLISSLHDRENFVQNLYEKSWNLLITREEEDVKENSLRSNLVKVLNEVTNLTIYPKYQLIPHFPLILQRILQILSKTYDIMEKYPEENVRIVRKGSEPLDKFITTGSKASLLRSIQQSPLSKKQSFISEDEKGKIELFGFGFKQGGSVKTWKLRYFILYSNGDIEYYKMPTSLSKPSTELLDITKGELKGKINIKGHSISEEKIKGYNYCMVITQEERNYPFAFQSRDVGKIWNEKCCIIASKKEIEIEEYKTISEYAKELFTTLVNTLIYLLKTSTDLCGSNNRSNLYLGSYVKYFFKNETFAKTPFYVSLTECLSSILERQFDPSTKLEVTQFKKEALDYSWFFFDLIVKSFLFTKPEDEGESFANNLINLMRLIGEKVFDSREKKDFTRNLNLQISKFFTDLSYEMNLEYCFESLNSYFISMDRQMKTELKKNKKNKTVTPEVMYVKNFYLIYNILDLNVRFLKVFFDHDQIVAMNNLSDITNQPLFPVKMMINIFKDVYYFDKRVKVYSNDIIIDEKQVMGQSLDIHQEMIGFFTYTITKHELDQRYKDNKEILGRLYFPMIIFLLNVDYDQVLNKNYDAFILFIFKNLNEEFTLKWMKQVTDEVLVSFLKLISSCLNKFSSKKQETIKTAYNIFYKLFLQIYSIKKDKILELQIQKDKSNLLETMQYKSDSNLLEISINFIYLIIKVDLDHQLNYIKNDKHFQEILMEICRLQKGELYWKWIYGILLQGIQINLSEPDPFFYDVIKIIEETVELPQIQITIPTDSQDIEFDKSNEIKSATLDKLIGYLFMENKNFVKQFFLTYRSFTQPYELFEILKIKYSEIKDEKQYIKIFEILELWLSEYFYDFEITLIVNIFKFLRKVVNEKNLNQVNHVKNILETILVFNQNIQKKKSILKPPPLKILPATIVLKSEKFDLTTWDPLELARQITLIEYKIFSKIQPRECFGLSWTKKNKEITSPNIVELTNRFNNFSYWLATLIVKEEDLEKRQKLMNHIIMVATILSEKLHNYNAVSTITGAWNNAAIFRLKKTMNGLPNETLVKKGELDELVLQTGNYKNLRNALKCDPPCIPYLGVFLTDLTFIEEGSSNMIQGTYMINFNKRRQFAEVLLQIHQLQQNPYNFEDIKELQNIIIECKDIWDDAELFKQSLKVEPRESKPADPDPQKKRKSLFII